MLTALQIAFAGLGAISLIYVVGAVTVAVLILAAIYSPIDKIHFAFAAVLVCGMMGTYSIGLKDGGKRCAAQGKIINIVVDKAVAKSKADIRSRDPYDSPQN